jgi:hypothetical protein
MVKTDFTEGNRERRERDGNVRGERSILFRGMLIYCVTASRLRECGLYWTNGVNCWAISVVPCIDKARRWRV